MAACNVTSRYSFVMGQHADIVAATKAAYYSGGSINLTEDAKPHMARLHKINQVRVVLCVFVCVLTVCF